MTPDEQLEFRTAGYATYASEEGEESAVCDICEELLCAHFTCPNPLCLNGPCERCGREEVKHAA